MNKDIYFDIVREYTKEPRKENTVWAKTAKLCMLFGEFRHIDTIKQNLWNLANIYGGGDTALVILHSGDNKDIIMETTKGWENVRYMQLYEKNVGKNVADYVCVKPEFWEQFLDYEYILTNTWDSYLFRRVPEKFFKYDMVGSPMAHSYIELNGQVMNICGDSCTCDRCLQHDHMYKFKNFKNHPDRKDLYNGGFFLRHLRNTIHLCKTKPIRYNWETDEVYFSMSELTKPTFKEACEFGVAHFKHPNPVGCNQLWIFDEDYVRSLFT